MNDSLILARLERLEAQNARWRRGAALLALLLGACLAALSTRALAPAYAAPPAAQDLTARRLQIVDDAGKARMLLRVGDSGPTITLFDADTKPRAIWALDDKLGAKLSSISAAGKPQMTVGLHKGTPSLYLYDANSKVRYAATISKKKDKSFVFLFDKDGKVEAKLP